SDDNFDFLDTGDILGVSYGGIFGSIITSFTFSAWSHTGVIWKDPIDNKLYIIEGAMYDIPYQGIIKILFNLWLYINKNYKINYYKIWILLKKNINQVHIFQVILLIVILILLTILNINILFFYKLINNNYI